MDPTTPKLKSLIFVNAHPCQQRTAVAPLGVETLFLELLGSFVLPLKVLPHMRAGGCCKVANKYSGSFAPSRWSPPALKHKIEYGLTGNLTQCIFRASPMRTASGYQAPAVPYHTLICGSFSTPNTALVRKNAEYITNTKKALRVVLPA